MSTVPCRGCDDREVGCHTNCKPYNDWATQNKENMLEAKKRMPPYIKTSSFLSQGPKPFTRKRRK